MNNQHFANPVVTTVASAPHILLIVPIDLTTYISYADQEGHVHFNRAHITTIVVQLLFTNGNFVSATLVHSYNHHQILFVY